jgi:hypothetical protein
VLFLLITVSVGCLGENLLPVHDGSDQKCTWLLLIRFNILRRIVKQWITFVFVLSFCFSCLCCGSLLSVSKTKVTLFHFECTPNGFILVGKVVTRYRVFWWVFSNCRTTLIRKPGLPPKNRWGKRLLQFVLIVLLFSHK